MIEKSPQEWLETKNQSLCKIDELVERWNKRITLDDLRIDERFRSGELHIILHLRIKDTGEQWGVCLESARFQNKFLPAIPPSCREEGVFPHGENVPMLIDIIQFVNAPEHVVSALIWLKPIDEFYRFWPDALYFSSLLGFVSIPILRDGKADRSARSTVCPRDSKLICQLIERAPDVVDCVTSDSKRLEGIDGKVFPGQKGISKIRVLLQKTNLLVSSPSISQLDFEITDVLFGPFDFYPEQDDSVVGGEWHFKTSSDHKPVGGIISPYEDEFRQEHAG
jgi:hypothetical protein